MSVFRYLLYFRINPASSECSDSVESWSCKTSFLKYLWPECCPQSVNPKSMCMIQTQHFVFSLTYLKHQHWCSIVYSQPCASVIQVLYLGQAVIIHIRYMQVYMQYKRLHAWIVWNLALSAVAFIDMSKCMAWSVLFIHKSALKLVNRCKTCVASVSNALLP